MEKINGKERELLESPESHDRHNVTGNGKREGLKSVEDWAISSQATGKPVEGSTTRVWSLNRSGMAVKPHECAPGNRRYSLVLCENMRGGQIKNAAITKRPYTGKLDDLSEHPVKELIHKVLKNDCKKALDTAAHGQFKLTPLRVVPTAGTNTSAVTLTTNGTATLTNNVAMGKNHVKAIIDTMKERNIPQEYFVQGALAA